jgi:hypothetical protein
MFQCLIFNTFLPEKIGLKPLSDREKLKSDDSLLQSSSFFCQVLSTVNCQLSTVNCQLNQAPASKKPINQLAIVALRVCLGPNSPIL